MSRLQRHAAWAWLVVLVVGVLVAAALRLGPERTGVPSSAAATDTDGFVPGEPGTLAATAQRVHNLQIQVSRVREQLAAVQTEADDRRQRIAAIDALLSEDGYAECPAFLQEDNTVRALQKIIREAAGATRPDSSGEERLSTAAAVARERLRSKLSVMRDQFLEEAADQDAQAEVLRQQVRQQTEEVEYLQRVMQQELDRSTSAAATPPSGD